jgi:hypothetical protein
VSIEGFLFPERLGAADPKYEGSQPPFVYARHGCELMR